MRIMKTLLCLLLALLTLCAAAAAEDAGEAALRGYDKKEGYVYLTLGKYPQTKEGEELPILWRVLSVEDGRALLLSEYVLEARPIHGDYKEYANKPTHKTKPGISGDFAKTDMSIYLCGEFAYGSFAPGELALIRADEALGQFFLLSGDELKNKAYGFDSNESRKAWGTDYAKVNGLFSYMANRGRHSPYWTRSQSTSNAQAARCTKSKGELGYYNVAQTDIGMRPACWLDTDKAFIISGSGTMEEPFVLLTDEIAAPADPILDETDPAAE